jgi:hypothetical protein
MRNRIRLLLLLAPWLPGVVREGFAQANTNVPGGGSGQDQGEVQVGAGTQGDVTTGSSGTKARAGSGAADTAKKDAKKEAVKDGHPRAATPAGGRTADRSTEGLKK